MGIYVWHVICMCMLSHSMFKHKINWVGPDVLGIFNFTTLEKINYKLGFFDYINPQCASCNFWPDPQLLKSPGPKTPFGPVCNSLQTLACWPSPNPNQKTIFWAQILISSSSRSKTIWARLGLWAQSH